MAGITPANPVTASSSASTPGSGGSVTPVEAGVGSAPDKIQQLTHQIQVSGTLVQPPSDGQITLSTALGTLTIVLPQLAQDQMQKIEQQLMALFQSQKPLTVVLQPGNPPSQAFLMLPPASSSIAASGSAATGNALQSLINTISPPQPATLPPLVPGALLPAVVLQPVENALSSTALPGFASALIAEDLASVIEGAASPVAALPQPGMPVSTPVPTSPAFSTPLGEAPAAPVFNPAIAVPAATAAAQNTLLQTPLPNAAALSTPSLAVLFQPGTPLSLTVNSILPPGAALPTPALPNQIAATVIGSGPGGQLLLQAGNNTLYVQQPANVPVGSSLLITVAASKAAAPALLPEPSIGNFGALQPALVALAQTDPALAQQILQSIIPQPNPALAGTLFLLFAAFGQGDMQAWFGPSAADILAKAGKAELIARISQGLAEGGQLVNDPVVGAWHSYPVPVFSNAQFQLLHFYVHGERRWRGQGGQDEKAKPGARSVRFLIDMRLSKLGALQLDGFVRPKQLDMIIRSEGELPPGLDRDLRATYTNVLTAIDYAGTLSFQTGRQHWLFIKNPSVAGSVVT